MLSPVWLMGDYVPVFELVSGYGTVGLSLGVPFVSLFGCLFTLGR